MPVFLDPSKKRKWGFRSIAIALCLVGAVCVGVFSENLFLGKPLHPPVKYADTIEAYHYYYSAANNKKIALTIDDGPRPTISEKLMSGLKEANAPATFFYVGSNVLLNPSIAAEAAQRGFTIGSHSLTHQPGVHGSQERIDLELRSTGYLLSSLAGVKPAYYRPPFLLGIGIDPTINPYLPLPKDMLWTLEDGYIPVGSDIDPHDWLATSKDGVMAGLKKALADSPNGHIVLLHEEMHTAETIGDIVAYIRQQGYTIVPLSELLTPPTGIVLPATLSLGDTDAATGGAVSRLQWFLYQQGDLDAYLLTGVFGAETKAALGRYQSRSGLVDATNVDPTVFGVADQRTRDLIAKASQSGAAAVVLAPTPDTLWQKAGDEAGEVVKYAYVNFFPGLRALLVWMIGATIVLVVARAALVFSLLFLGWQRRRSGTADACALDTSMQRGVSVLIPAYNEEENIRSTVESVLGSPYPKKEVIVIDDGSTDSTSTVVQSVIDAHPGEELRLIKIPNGGKAGALNNGIDASHYDICVVLDADAVLEQGALANFVKHFADPLIGAVAGKVCTTGSRRLLDLFQTLEYVIGQNIDKRAFSVLGGVGVVPGPAGAWDRAAVMELGGFSNDTLVEDQEMTLRLLRAGKKVIYEPGAIAYTETPHTVSNFLKQRFRWIYGTMQCFWKNKRVFVEQPRSIMSLIVMPNIFIFNIVMPLTYPFADGALLFGLIFSDWQSLVIPFLLFTAIDITYASYGVWGEKKPWHLLAAVPLQRIVYRQLLYYTVARSVVRAIEGAGLGWNKFAKVGETQRFYFSSLESEKAAPYQEVPDDVGVALQGPGGTAAASMNLQEVTVLSVSPRQPQSAGETSSPAPALYVLSGFADPNTYAKSSSSNGPTSSH